jgi:gamma-glutamyl-gamma-aminobutyrate hydrolase PuuD
MLPMGTAAAMKKKSANSQIEKVDSIILTGGKVRWSVKRDNVSEE